MSDGALLLRPSRWTAAGSLDERSLRAEEAARAGYRDYAATHGITYGEARRRLRAAARAGRQRSEVASESG